MRAERDITMENNPQEPWERQILTEYLQTIHKDQRRERRWTYVLRFLRTIGFLLMATAILIVVTSRQSSKLVDSSGSRSPHAAVIALKGQISDNGANSADKLIPAIKSAFENEKAKGVIIKINSPGGSPVQAGRIYDEIQTLKSIYPQKKIYSVIDDLGASGGYYVAMAADQIFANRASLVGSIGVISSSFGFTDLMERMGIERRTFAAGQYKNLLDPFSPMTPDAAQFWEEVLAQTHHQFIERVRHSRGSRLAPGEDIFSGLVWNGEQALQLGLIDGLGSAESIAREYIEVDRLVNYTPTQDFISRLSSRVMSHASEYLHSSVQAFN